MKKILTLVCALMLSFAMAQETKNMDKTQEEAIVAVMQESASEKRNDIVLNPIALILGVVNVSYEHHINKDSGIGVSTIFILDDYVVGNTSYWHILPHYRYYFGKKWARGFFLEGFTGVIGQKYETIAYYGHYDYGLYFPNIYHTKNETNFGFGVGFGGKWETKGNILFEASLGIGRRLGSNLGEPIFAKGMLGVGIRF